MSINMFDLINGGQQVSELFCIQNLVFISSMCIKNKTNFMKLIRGNVL